MSLHENVAATAGFPEMTSRAAERWTEMLEAWVARLDDAKSNPANLDDLCCVLDEAVGQGEAWTRVAHLSHMCAATYYDAKAIVNARTAARDAILAIEMPDDTDD